MEIVNAQIKSTMLGIEDHGIMTFYLMLEWNGGGVGYGGYVLGGEFGINVIRKVLETVGVDTWEKLPNKYVRLEANGVGQKVTKLGNIISDKWMDIEQIATEAKGVSSERKG